MRGEVLLDLAFGFHDEAQIDAIAGEAGGDPDGERACIPKGIEPRRTVVELREALLRPREMFFLLSCGHGELAPDARIDGKHGLRGVERLGADLSRVIDAHETGGVAAFRGREHGVVQIGAGYPTRRRRHSGEHS